MQGSIDTTSRSQLSTYSITVGILGLQSCYILYKCFYREIENDNDAYDRYIDGKKAINDEEKDDEK